MLENTSNKMIYNRHIQRTSTQRNMLKDIDSSVNHYEYKFKQSYLRTSLLPAPKKQYAIRQLRCSYDKDRLQPINKPSHHPENAGKRSHTAEANATDSSKKNRFVLRKTSLTKGGNSKSLDDIGSGEFVKRLTHDERNIYLRNCHSRMVLSK